MCDTVKKKDLDMEQAVDNQYSYLRQDFFPKKPEDMECNTPECIDFYNNHKMKQEQQNILIKIFKALFREK